MGIPAITYHRAASLREACELGHRFGAEGAFLAGGTELLPDYQSERETARHLIALDSIEELRGIGFEGGTSGAGASGSLRIGALATAAEIAASPLVRKWFPALAEAARAIGSPQIRSLATIGGNFCRAVPCADTPPAALAGEARLRLVGRAGPREVEAEQFFLGPRQTILLPGEVLVAVLLPPQPRRSGASYQRFARRRGSALPVAAVAARITLAESGQRITGARIALGAVAPVPLLARRAAMVLEGERASTELFALAGAVSAEEALPITDLRGSAGFRRELVTVLARRALVEAAARAEAHR